MGKLHFPKTAANEMYNQKMASDENYVYFTVSRRKSKDEYEDIFVKSDFRTGEHIDLINLTKEFDKKKVKLYGTTDKDILLQISDITNTGDNANVSETIVAYNTDGKKIMISKRSSGILKSKNTYSIKIICM